MNENQRALLERALATIENSTRHVAWLPKGPDTDAIITEGLVHYIEDSKYGDMIAVGAPKNV